MKKVGIIGAGKIAGCLKLELETRGYVVCFSFDINHTGPSLEELLESEKPLVVFLTISTLDAGEAARDYIIACVRRNIRVITCEKGALSYHAEILMPYLKLIGFSATVSGGTEALNYVRGRHLAKKQAEIFAVINGTLNFIFDEMQRGRSLAEACVEAKNSGYAEPGASTPINLINGELRDVRMKTCVFFNTTLAREKFITSNELELIELRTEDMERLSDEGGDYRLIISFSNHKLVKEYAHLGKQFSYSIDGWHIAGAFRQISQTPQLSSWLPGGVGNAVHIVEGELGAGGKYTLSGPGAGLKPTVSAMLDDLDNFC